jgi:hypothetical protein
LADRLKEGVREIEEERIPDPCSLAGDILGWAFNHVDWYEIASHAVADYQEIEECSGS